MQRVLFPCLFFAFAMALVSCRKEDANQPQDISEPSVIFKFHFDEDQERLDNFGNPSVMPIGHAAQTPRFNTISGHYVELIPNAQTWLGDGEVVYQGPETTAGGDNAVDFDQAILVGERETFLSIPLSSLSPDTYEFLRVSLSYQNFEIDFQSAGFDLEGTIASFLGYNNYISSYDINGQTITVNDDKLQGYWGFETLGQTIEGQAPEGATTVVNPLFDSSPIPPRSCLVTGEFSEPLVVTGNETTDIVIIMSLSVNDSFEWVDDNADGVYQPDNGEQVVDMGIRGMIPSVE